MKKYFLGLLLLTTQTLAGDALIWYGSTARILPDYGLTFSRTEKLLADLISDPSSGVGTVASTGSIGILNNGGTGELWLKTGSGDTAWTNIGIPAAPVSSAPSINALPASTDDYLVRWDGVNGSTVDVSPTSVNDAGLLTTANIAISTLTANTNIYLNGAKQIASSTITLAETGYLSGASSNIQNQLDNKLSSALGNGQIYLGNASNQATATIMSGDVTIDNAGSTAIQPGVIVDADINAAANISRTKIASGSANHVIINDGAGVLSSEALLALSRGGTNKNTIASNGAIVYSDADSFELSAVGTLASQVLISGGAGAPTWSTIANLTGLDHGALVGLLDDDHTQYALLAGRAGGQIETGGTASGNNLTLRSTTDATKGLVKLDETTITTSATTGALVVDGGIGVGGSVFIGSGLKVTGTTTLDSSLTGPLQALFGVVTASPINLSTATTGVLPIANGGTSNNNAPAAFNALSPLMVKGDILGYSTANGAFPIGQTNGSVLVVDSTQNFGIRWAAAASGSSTVYAWAGTHGNDCLWSRTSTTFGDPTADATCTFTEKYNLNFGTVTSYLSGGDKQPGLVLSPPVNGDYWVCAMLSRIESDAAEGQIAFKLSDGTTDIGISSQHRDAGGTAQSEGNATICGIWSTTTGSKTLRIQSAAVSGAATLRSTGTITPTQLSVGWSIFKIN